MGNDSSKIPGGRGKRGVGITLKSGPSSATVQRHLENARKSRVLQLKACGLKNVPEQLKEVHEILRNLDLSDNRIRELPEIIGSFSNLKQLHFSGNQLQILPDEVGMLKKLEVLNAARNMLCCLPESFVGLCSLKVLNLSGNKFVTMPLVLCHLQSLDNLDMSINLLEKLPDEVEELKASELNLNQNRLSSLNENLARCERLKTLRVEENCLNKKDFSPELLSNSNISLIAYAGNLFQDKDFQSLPGYEDYQGNSVPYMLRMVKRKSWPWHGHWIGKLEMLCAAVCSRLDTKVANQRLIQPYQRNDFHGDAATMFGGSRSESID